MRGETRLFTDITNILVLLARLSTKRRVQTGMNRIGRIGLVTEPEV
jgi:hypothetical protein